MFNLFFDKHLTPFRMVAPSNAPSPDLRGLTQPQKNIRITNHQQNWNCDFGLECCFKSQHFRTGATNNCWAPGSIIAAGAWVPGKGQELHREAQECCPDSEEEYCDLIWLYDVLRNALCIRKTPKPVHESIHKSTKFRKPLACIRVEAKEWKVIGLSDSEWAFWAGMWMLHEAAVASLTHQGILRDLGMLPRSIYIFSTSRWKGLLNNMADIYDVKTPTFLKQSLHRKRFQTICDLELVVSACSVCRCALGFSKSVHVFWQKNMCIHGCMLQTPYMLHVCISSEKQYIYILMACSLNADWGKPQSNTILEEDKKNRIMLAGYERTAQKNHTTLYQLQLESCHFNCIILSSVQTMHGGAGQPLLDHLEQRVGDGAACH